MLGNKREHWIALRALMDISAELNPPCREVDVHSAIKTVKSIADSAIRKLQPAGSTLAPKTQKGG